MKKLIMTLEEHNFDDALKIKDSAYIEEAKDVIINYEDLLNALFEHENENVRNQLLKDLIKDVDFDELPKLIANLLSYLKKNMEFDDARDSKIIDLCIQTIKLYSD